MSSKYHVKKLEKKNDHLSILWKDNFESKFHFMWLRDCLLYTSDAADE